jgi:eukaryotic-like serine/threonine-protein kinase
MVPSGGEAIHESTRAEELLAHYIERRLAGDGQSALERLCAERPELAGELRSLVREYEGIRDLLERPAEPAGFSSPDAAPTLEASGVAPSGAAAGAVRPEIGTSLGHLRIVGHLGSGGMGEVFVAEDELLERRVALKTIRKDRARSEQARVRFLREARSLSRLDHPGICRIYDYREGVTLDFLVLELIEGRTLSQAAEELDEPAKLRVAEQIADALVAAHREGIVHRDLKPGNVMLTPAGDAKVLDFGLARLGGPRAPDDPDDEGAEDESLPAEDAARAGPGATAFGAVLGTPRYMSPEQARGEPATAASDLYSFGLMLHELCSATPPHPSGLSVERLLRRAAQGEVDPPAGVRRDLRDLIRDLEAPRPADRPSAREALERVRFIRDRPRRLARRAAAAAAVLVALLAGFKYTVDLRAERSAARAAQALAESRRDQAERLIGFMIGELRGKLAPIAQLAVLDDVSEQALDYFAAVPAEELSDEERYRRAQVLSQLADLRIEQGRLDQATAPLEESLRLTTDLVAHDPGRADWLLAHGTTQYWLGAVAMRRADYPAALGWWQAYSEVARRLVELDPADLEHRAEIVYTESNLGSVLRRMGRLDEARDRFAIALEEVQTLADEHPQDGRFQRDLATTLQQNAVLARQNGELDRARALFERQAGIAERALSADGSILEWRRERARALLFLLGATIELGDDDAALALTDEVCPRLEQLAAEDPDHTGTLRDLATCEGRAAALRLRRGELATASALVRRRLERAGSLARDNPTDVRRQLDWAEALLGASELELARGAASAALARAQGARGIVEPLQEERPDDETVAVAAAGAWWAVGAALAGLGRDGEARRAFEEAARTIEPHAAGSRDPEVLGAWSLALLQLDPTRAREALERLAATGSRSTRIAEAARAAGLALFEETPGDAARTGRRAD